MSVAPRLTIWPSRDTIVSKFLFELTVAFD